MVGRRSTPPGSRRSYRQSDRPSGRHSRGTSARRRDGPGASSATVHLKARTSGYNDAARLPLPVFLPQRHQGDAGPAAARDEHRPNRARPGAARPVGCHGRFQHTVAQRRRQRPAQTRCRDALQGRRHPAARDAQRSGDRPVGCTTCMLAAQDLPYSSHRHSLGWHRSPRSLLSRRAERRAPPRRSSAVTPFAAEASDHTSCQCFSFSPKSAPPIRGLASTKPYGILQS
jgi:hypothetical protein